MAQSTTADRERKGDREPEAAPPRAPTTTDPVAARMLGLQRGVGNQAVSGMVSRSLVQRDDKPAPAPAAPATPQNDAHFQGMISDRITAINNAYQAVFERQQRAVNDLAKDFEKVDEVSMVESVLQAAVEAALSKGIEAIGQKVFAFIAAAQAEGMAKRAAQGYSGYIPPGLTAEDLVAGDIASAKATAKSLAEKAEKFTVGKAQAGVPKAMSGLSLNLPSSSKFIQGQQAALQSTKEEAQDALTDQVAPGLRTGGQKEALLAAGALLDAVRGAVDEAQPLQYLRSVGQWAEQARGTNADPTSTAGGTLKLTVDLRWADGKITVKEARMQGMDADVLARIKSTPTLSGRRLGDMPIHKAVVSDGLFVFKPANGPVTSDSVRSGSLKSWARKKNPDFSADGPSGEMVAAALLFNEIDNLKFSELGDIKHGSGQGVLGWLLD